jgi:hypothetical protein
MSLARLFLSGLLVAGGLILGAFTLHGYLDPQWAQRQTLAAGAQGPPRDVKAINTFRDRSRFVSTRRDQPAPGDRQPPPPAHSATTTSGPVVKAAADPRAVAKPPVRKKAAEKPKKPPQPPPQQQAAVWPWNLFGN